MDESEVQEDGDDNLLKFPEDGLVPLSQEEVDALLEIDIENDEESEVDEIDDLVTDALIAKLMLRREMWLGVGYATDAKWKKYYNSGTERFACSLKKVIAKCIVDFSDIQRERFASIGIVTFRDLCLLNEEELRKAGFEDSEIESIKAILRRFKLWLMG